MKFDKFVTEIHKGKFIIDDAMIRSLNDWLAFEKDLDPEGLTQSTTNNGWQYSFTPKDKTPDWLQTLQQEIKQVKDEVKWNMVKSSWVVDYNTGGFQDAHFHQPENNLKTIIFNLKGEGDLLLFDPRPMAVSHGETIVEVMRLLPGDWISMPSWLVHSTRPCQSNRTIYVMDVHS